MVALFVCAFFLAAIGLGDCSPWAQANSNAIPTIPEASQQLVSRGSFESLVFRLFNAGDEALVVNQKPLVWFMNATIGFYVIPKKARFFTGNHVDKTERTIHWWLKMLLSTTKTLPGRDHQRDIIKLPFHRICLKDTFFVCNSKTQKLFHYYFHVIYNH